MVNRSDFEFGTSQNTSLERELGLPPQRPSKSEDSFYDACLALSSASFCTAILAKTTVVITQTSDPFLCIIPRRD